MGVRCECTGHASDNFRKSQADLKDHKIVCCPHPTSFSSPITRFLPTSHCLFPTSHHLLLSASCCLSPAPISHHASMTAPTTALHRPVCFLTTQLQLHSPDSFLTMCRFLGSQLTLAGKGYGLMYSVWAQFHNIIGEGSSLIGSNPSLLSPRQVQP